jgi:drug/metabolite transporter (DMT)-like permease
VDRGLPDGRARRLGHYLLALAHRYAPASVIAPFLYQQVIYMALFGYLVFGDVPSPWVWLGAAVSDRQRPVLVLART